MQSWILRSTTHVPFVGLRGGWAPQMMKFIIQIMENQTKKKELVRNLKWADFEPIGPFAPFLIIESLNSEHPLSKLSPFVIEKVLVSLAGSPKFVKKHQKISEDPLWTSKSPTYNYFLASDKKATTDPIFF